MVIGFVLVELFLGFLFASVSNATQPRPSSGGRLISITFATVSYGQRLSGPRSAFSAPTRRSAPTGSDYPVLQDYEACKKTFACIDLPGADRDKVPHHNVQALFGFAR